MMSKKTIKKKVIVALALLNLFPASLYNLYLHENFMQRMYKYMFSSTVRTSTTDIEYVLLSL